jgi:probable HAF family extracellular repeat protein
MSSSATETRAYLWSPANGMVGAAVAETQGVALNDAGQVVGYDWSPTTVRGFTWTPPSPLTLLPALGADAGPASVNSNGDVVGYAEIGPLTMPVIWQGTASPITLGSLGGTWGAAWSINDAGVVVGGSKKADDVPRAFYWTQSSGMQALAELFPGQSSVACAANASGQIVGSAQFAGFSHAVLWPSPTSFAQDLGTLPGSINAWANDINDASVIVGGSGGKPFVRDSAGMKQLSVAGESLGAAASAINAEGDIVGSVTRPDGGTRAVVWWRQVVPGFPYRIASQTIVLGPGPLVATLLGSPRNDVRVVQLSTVTLGDGSGVETPVSRRGDRFVAQYADVNRDGELDLQLQFDESALIEQGDLTRETTELWLQGVDRTRERPVTGTMAVRIVR